MDLHRNSPIIWCDRATLLSAAAVSLGCALVFNDGRYAIGAIILLAVTCALVAWAMFAPVAPTIIASSKAGGLPVIAIIAIYLSFGFVRLQRVPEPFMDVFDFQRESCRALQQGKNPYAITMPDIYGDFGGWVYAPQLRQNGRLAFGFPYMPLILAWDYLGHLAAPDFRYANLIAMAVAGFLIWLIDRSYISAIAAALLLLSPKGIYIIEKGWTEPLSIALLAATILLASRKSKFTPIALGLLIASKQYCVLLVPFIPMNRRSIAITVITAAAVTLPAFVINPRAFWNSVGALQFIQPFRDDSISFPAALAHAGGPHIGGAIAIVASLALAIFCTIKRQPLALSIAAVFLLFFAFNKQAFGNYYLFVIAAICCAIPFTPPPANVR